MAKILLLDRNLGVIYLGLPVGMLTMTGSQTTMPESSEKRKRLETRGKNGGNSVLRGEQPSNIAETGNH
jgi:hypothetical protein